MHAGARRMARGIARFGAILLACGLAVVTSAREVVDMESRAPRELVPGVLIAGQVMPEDVSALHGRGVRTIVAMRPDGEDQGQPSAADVEAAARAQGVAFANVPVAGRIGPAQVDGLAAVLARTDGPVVLYCRSGRRAALTWALAEASRPDGRDAAAIRAALESAGQSAGGLEAEIASRIAARPSP